MTALSIRDFYPLSLPREVGETWAFAVTFFYDNVLNKVISIDIYAPITHQILFNKLRTSQFLLEHIPIYTSMC